MPGDPQTPTRKLPSARKGVPHKRPRRTLSCEPCRISKLRCDRQQPCSSCRRRECGSRCIFRRVRDVAINQPTIADDVSESADCGSPSRPHEPQVTVSIANTTDLGRSATPTLEQPTTSTGQTHSPQVEHPSSIAPWNAVLERPASGRDSPAIGQEADPLASFAFGPKRSMSALLGLLPSSNTREFLVSRYFTYQAPLFHILHGPTFQQQYAEFTRDPAQASLSWLALLFTLCSLAVQTLEPSDAVLMEIHISQPDISPCDTLSLSRHFRSAALACLSEARFMVRHDLNTLEALLVMAYGICHSEGVDRAWIFLGVALNMGIVLRCNIDHFNQNFVEQQRRRRCWAGIRMLYTYQGILFRDVDPSFLLSFPFTMPAEVDDIDIHVDGIKEPSAYPNSMSLIKFKLRLFEISTQICSRLSNGSSYDEATMNQFDTLIGVEQKHWASAYIPSGCPSFLDTASFAYWCILETYAYQLFLLIHRPFYHSQSPHFLPCSRKKYAESSIALLETYEKLCELPTLRPYRWLVNGMTSFNALQGVVALAACLMDKHGQEDTDTTGSYGTVFDNAVMRIRSLQNSSPVCERAYPEILKIQTQISALDNNEAHTPSQNWDASVNWLDENSIDWVFWDTLMDNVSLGAQQ